MRLLILCSLHAHVEPRAAAADRCRLPHRQATLALAPGGLTLVKTLTEMHGGVVEVRSDGAGLGSEFVVRLPLAAETDTPASKPTATQSAPTAPLRILIVDDNRDSAEMLASLLQFTGHETFAAHDGLAAVEAAAKFDPDVILLDIGLPVLDGYEAARRIRKQQGQKRRPVLVALTGWGQGEDRRRSEEAGSDAHLVKPVDTVVLGRLLAELARPGTKWRTGRRTLRASSAPRQRLRHPLSAAIKG